MFALLLVVAFCILTGKGSETLKDENARLQRVNKALLEVLASTSSMTSEQAVGMNKNEVADSIASKADLTVEQARNTLQATMEIIMDAVAEGEEVYITGFGSFERRDRRARTGRNPKTGEPMIIPATKVPAFSPGKSFKEAVSGNSLALEYDLEYAVAQDLEYAVGMTKDELVDSISSRAGVTTEQARNSLEAMLETIIEAVAEGDKVVLIGFGSFETRFRKARTGRNPKTGEVMRIPETYVPAFAAANTFKEIVSGNPAT